MADYKAPWYLPGSLTVWAWANLARQVPKPKYTSFAPIHNPTNDPDSFFELAWIHAEKGEIADRVALVAPGLSGGAYSKPTRGMVRALNEEGWDVAVWVFRDTGTTPTSVRATYSGYGLDDLTMAVERLERDYSRIDLVGMSLGGACVLQYAARVTKPHVTKVVSISPPIDFGACVETWSRGLFGRLVISPLVTSGMRSKARKKERTGALDPDDVDAYNKVRNVTGADHYINTEFNGYDSASDYWYKATTARDVWGGRFAADTLIIIARDDYLLNARSYPHPEALPKNVRMELPGRGSHIGFVTAGSHHRYWSEQRTVDHLNA